LFDVVSNKIGESVRNISKMAQMLAGRTSKVNGGITEREDSVLNALHDSTNVYFNYTGAYPCTNLSDWEGTGNLDGFGWNILACNQLFMPTGFGEDSMFIPLKIDYASYTKMCQDNYGLTPQYNWALDYFGGYNIDKDFLSVTNIVWSNGELDPWRAGGLNKNVSADGSSIALYIEGGAHHLDLRPPNDLDPPLVT
jgi:lysosomal Pro-X carboxypeptidase